MEKSRDAARHSALELLGGVAKEDVPRHRQTIPIHPHGYGHRSMGPHGFYTRSMQGAQMGHMHQGMMQGMHPMHPYPMSSAESKSHKSSKAHAGLKKSEHRVEDPLSASGTMSSAASKSHKSSEAHAGLEKSGHTAEESLSASGTMSSAASKSHKSPHASETRDVGLVDDKKSEDTSTPDKSSHSEYANDYHDGYNEHELNRKNWHLYGHYEGNESNDSYWRGLMIGGLFGGTSVIVIMLVFCIGLACGMVGWWRYSHQKRLYAFE
eukprot:722997_1